MPLTLTAAQSSQLSFWTIWDIEAGWDGGIVEISTNGGATWTRLTPNPPGYPDQISHTGQHLRTALANGTPAFSSANDPARHLAATDDRSLGLCRPERSPRLALWYG